MSAWFPSWLLLVMSLAYAGIAAAHIVHTAARHGPARLWTAAHVLMATGMLVMVLPTDRMVVSGTPVVLAFVVAAVGCLVVAVRAVRGRRGADLWFVAAVDLGAMAYMFAEPSVQSLVVSLLLAVVVAVEAAYWASGHLLEIAERDGLAGGPAAGTPDDVAVPVRAAAVDVAALVLAPTRSAHLVSLRVSMTLSALGMAYMLAAMALAAPAVAGGGHVHGMPGL
jgi:Domain of unknown function (DUF5134)